MAGELKHLRSSTTDKRPTASGLGDGRIAINTASGSPGLFFKDNADNIVKVGPVFVGSGAPNASPASGGSSGNSIGEQWLDTSDGNYVFKIWDGGEWRSEAGEFVNVSGDTMTGDLVMDNADLVFEGSTDDGFETVLTVVNPTADNTITLPNVTGTVVTTGDNGTVTSGMILDGTIGNAEINSSADIEVSKLGAGAANTVLVTDFTGNTVQFATSLNLTGSVTANAGFTTSGTTAFNAGFSASSSAFQVANVTGNVSTTGTLGVSGLTSLDGGINVDDAFTVTDSNGNVTTTGTLAVSGLASLDGGIDVDGAFTVADSNGNTSTTGTLGVSGLASLDGGINVDDAFSVADTTGNISSTGALNVSGNITSSGTLNTTGLASLDGGIDVDGAFTVANTSGNINTTGTLSASGLASFDGGIDADGVFTVQDGTGNIETSGTITASGNISSGGNLLPLADNTGNVGTNALTWADGRFTNLTIDNTINVRNNIDLADSPNVLRFGDSDDAKFFYDGGNSNFELELESDCTDFLITDNGTTRFTFNKANGDFTATGDVTAFSDINLKENIEVIPNALDKVLQIRGVTYNRIDTNRKRQAGVIAQEVEKVLPEVIRTDRDGVKSVAYGKLVGLLVEAIKELNAEVEQLKGGLD